MDSASDREAKASNGGGDSHRGTPNHHGNSSSAMSIQQAQQVQAQAAAMNALGLLDPSALFGTFMSHHFIYLHHKSRKKHSSLFRDSPEKKPDLSLWENQPIFLFLFFFVNSIVSVR